MRYLIIIFILICSLCSYGQVKQDYNQYGGRWNRLALKYNGGFQLPRTTLSTRDLNVSAPDTGQVYYNTADSSVYYHTGSQWIKFVSGVGSTPTLQQVLTAGNQTTLDIGTDGTGFLNIGDLAQEFGGSTIAIGGNNQSIYLRANGSTGNSEIAGVWRFNATGELTANAFNLTDDLVGNKLIFNQTTTSTPRTWTLPDETGTIALISDISGSGTPNANVGSGYRILKPGTQEVKTVHAGTGILIDSTSNSNEITFTKDPDYDIRNQSTLQTAKFYVDSGQVAQKIGFDPVSNLTLDSVAVFGASIELGQAASGSNGYIQQFRTNHSFTLVDNSVSGMGGYVGAAAATSTIDTMKSLAIITQNQFNDWRRGGFGNKTVNKIFQTTLVVAAQNFIKGYVGAGDASVTAGGAGWNSYNATLVGGKFSTGRYNATSTRTLTWNFSGTSLVIGYTGTDSSVAYRQGRFSVTIDGNVVDTVAENGKYDGISDGANDNGRGPAIYVKRNLINTTHTVVVTLLDNLTTTFDYFGVLKEPGVCYPVFLVDPPYMNSTGYAISPANATDGTMDYGGVLNDSIITVFSGYPVYRVTTNNTYDVGTGLDADNIHPNDTGHGQILSELDDSYDEWVADQLHLTDGDIYYTGRAYKTLVNGVLEEILFSSNAVSGVNTMAAVGSSPNANGATIAGTTLTLQPADISHPGVINTSRQVLGTGDKVFNGGIQINGALVSPAGAGFELEYSGGTAYVTAYDRGGSSFLPMTLRYSQLNFNPNNANKLIMTQTSSAFSHRVLLGQGADVASLNGAIALGSDGNSFEITGTNTITLISNVNWQNGSEVTFLFTSTATLTDGTANSGTDIGMELAGNANFVGSAGATLTLILSEIGGTQRWREKCRSVQ